MNLYYEAYSIHLARQQSKSERPLLKYDIAMPKLEVVMNLGHGLKGKTVLVTGGSRGLGRHFGELFAANGADVIVTARKSEALEPVIAAVRAAGGSIRGVMMDVTDGVSVEAGIGRTAEHGIDILINNAGIAISKPVLDFSEGEWDAVADTNLKGNFMVATSVARHMKARGRGGSIVNIASILGIGIAGNVAAYAATKAGVIHLTRAMALELARYDIRVNALCPGYMETDLNRSFIASEPGKKLIKRIPQRRLGALHELDGPVLLLAGAAGSYITGATLAVDGGHLITSL